MRGSGVRKSMRVLLCVEGGRISRTSNHEFGHQTSPPSVVPPLHQHGSSKDLLETVQKGEE